MNEPLLEYCDVTVEGVDQPRLDAVSLRIPDGRLTVVVGPSGAGKSTLLRLANRLEVPDEGRISFRGVDIATADVPAHRRRLGMLFQRPVAFPGTVHDNFRVVDPEMDGASARELLGRAHLSADLLDRDAATLSGGEAQRMCLARALAAKPDALLLDEPTAALDAQPRLALEGLVRELCDSGVAAVWVTHDLEQMERLADEVVVLLGGRVAHQRGARPFTAGAGPEAIEFLEARP